MADETEALREIRLTPEDQAMIVEITAGLQMLWGQLGQERDTYLAVEDHLREQIGAKHQAYNQLVHALSKKYLREGGEWDFRPQTGGWIERTKENGK